MGLETVEQEKMLTIVPNPTNGKVKVLNLSLENATISIFDNMGRKVKNSKSQKQYIDISELTSGLYYLTVYKDKRLYNASLVKR